MTPAALSLYCLVVIDFIPDGEQIGDPAAADEEIHEVVPQPPILTNLKFPFASNAIMAPTTLASYQDLRKTPIWHLLVLSNCKSMQRHFGTRIVIYYL